MYKERTNVWNSLFHKETIWNHFLRTGVLMCDTFGDFCLYRHCFVKQFPASSTGGPAKCHCSGSPDKKTARCCCKEYWTNGRWHQGGHWHQGYNWWHWRLVGQTQAACRRGQDGDKEKMNIQTYTDVTKWGFPSTASEQHARCDHLDVERREAGRLCSGSSKWGSILQLQRRGPWQTLWTDPNHIHAGARLDRTRYSLFTMTCPSSIGQSFFLFISTQWTKIKAWRSPFSWGSACGSAFLPWRKSLTASRKEASASMRKWWRPFSESDPILARCEWVIAMFTRFVFCSMKTRPLFWASGEPPASSAATSSRTSPEKWSSNGSAFYLLVDGNGRMTGLLTQHHGKL